MSLLLCLVAALFIATNVEATTTGSFSVLSMNVAGLPAIFNGNDVPGDKATNAGTIGSTFAKYGYDVIHVQEDFNYHAYIYATDTHPYRTATSGGAGIGSGLNTLSNFPFADFKRTKWNTCSDASGNDCLTPKGLTFMRVTVADGVYIDFYNLHADAGTLPGDETARTSNIQQVADYISTWSTGNAVIVFGDTNSRYTRTADNIPHLSTQSLMSDAWVVLEHGGNIPTTETICDNPSLINTCETVDKVFYHGNSIVSLNALYFNYESTKYHRVNGSILSDHNPITVDFSWSLSPTRRQSDFWGGPHGTWFNDLQLLPSSPKTSSMTFRAASRLDAVSMTLTSATTFTHGGTGGTAISIKLASDEYWTSAQLCQGQYSGHTRNYHILATTSKGRSLAASTATSDCATFAAPAGFQIVGFLGRDDDEMMMRWISWPSFTHLSKW